MNEFAVIGKYFQNHPLNRSDVILGSGDDCALLKIPSDQLLAVSVDTLISGVHFPDDLAPYEIGYKSLAVNLSDLAAMGAEPAWFTCALTLSHIEENWLGDFSRGLFECAKKYNIQLVGGDLTKGKVLSITIAVNGFVPHKLALKRSGAKIGDFIYVSGKLGEAYSKNYYYRPEPKINLGLALRGKANSAIDISDGLLGDLNHILESSDVGASIYLDKIPLVTLDGLTAGDDYELCFTAPENLNIPEYEIYCIGKIEAEKGVRVYQKDGSLYQVKKSSYQHF
jgi:thiamine-monophosphate kinase